jgi:hypothetical protein
MTHPRRNQTPIGLITVRPHPEGYLEGRPVRGSDRRGALLARFLQSDVQSDVAAARALLAEIGAVEAGQAPQPAAIGNAYSVTISRDGVLVRNALIEGSRPQHYGCDEMRLALGIWIAAIERARRSPG